MRPEGKSAIFGAVFASAFCLTSGSLTGQAVSAELKPAISSLGYFTGDWDCAGKFDSSGKTIEARQHFAADLDEAWIVFRHDDQPPFDYHSLAEWGWDPSRKEFVMTVQDSAGGVRLFYSNGWNPTHLQWDGGASVPSQRFSFERLDERHFRVSYFTRKNGDWSRVDSSTCSKQ